MPLLILGKFQTLFSGHWLGRSKRMVKRDPRYAIRTNMIYRKRGGLFWYKGILEDFSLTGVRFRGEQYLPSESPVEMSFTVHKEMGDKGGAEFFCWAKVVRSVLPTLSDSQFGLAARILHYRAQEALIPDLREVVGEVRGPLSVRKGPKQAPST